MSHCGKESGLVGSLVVGVDTHLALFGCSVVLSSIFTLRLYLS